MMKHLLLAAALAGASASASAAQVDSISRIEFGPADTLFVADWVQSKVHALSLPAAPRSDDKPFNIIDLEARLRKALGSDDVTLEDMAARPATGEVYIAVSVGPKRTPGIVVVSADGRVRPLNLAAVAATSAALENAPAPDLKFWGKIPGRSFTVTDMKWRSGKLYLAGLSNQDFASSLRILGYPFGGKGGMASVEMYHTVHNQTETRAPIRAMAFTELDGKPYLLAAYLCTPLVTIPLEALTDGAHVRAKTIAELGYAGTPVNVIPYNSMDMKTGKPVPYVLVANLYRESSIVPLASIAEANLKPGYSTPTPFGQIAGVQHMGAPMAGVLRVDNQNEKFFVALRRDLATGKAQLVSINKMLAFRLSDFDMSEYLFPDYQYTDPKQATQTKPMQNMLKVDEGYPDQVRQ